MEKLTYKEAFDKITEAYIKGEIKPMEAHFCFCGTLCSNTADWFRKGYPGNRFGSHGYSGKELGRMEWELIFSPDNWWREILVVDDKTHPKYEDALFDGMCAALEVLKQIHKERGENVEDFQFTKRQNLNLCHTTQK